MRAAVIYGAGDVRVSRCLTRCLTPPVPSCGPVTVSRAGAPRYADEPTPFGVFMRNVTLTGGVAPARAYIDELLPGVPEGRIGPGKVLDLAVGLDDIARGYKAMADRTALKVLVRP